MTDSEDRGEETATAAGPRRGTPSIASQFSPGDLLAGRYRIVRFVARGGMGEVYEAQDLELGERVALKTVRPEIAGDERTMERFRRVLQANATRIAGPPIRNHSNRLARSEFLVRQ